jgi:hypothetical protein
MKPLLFALFALLIAMPGNAQQGRLCKGNPRVVDQCFNIHGRVRVVNGAGTVIWRIGTDRLLEVEDEEIIPDNLGRAMYKKGGDVYGRDVFGDFEVCPFSKSKEGEMQMVCVESASHLVVRDNTH